MLFVTRDEFLDTAKDRSSFIMDTSSWCLKNIFNNFIFELIDLTADACIAPLPTLTVVVIAYMMCWAELFIIIILSSFNCTN
ncbi:Uncharacterized protein HZ326_14196 [Fusarium oxysporum f. sp. albedinis]|nr:Uncharacterized protein HZ326_14196 [Fusarium oxysporum f. sp. albedinis]